jgi:hypothetical protein
MAQTQINMHGTADCRMTNRSVSRFFRLSGNLLCCFVLLCLFAGGCSIFGKGSKKLSFEKLATTYNSITLKKSLTLDVIPVMQRSEAELGPMLAETELLSRSDNTVASLGQSKDRTLTWFNMVSFSEDNLTAERKYFFEVTERKPTLTGKVNKGMVFDCEMVLNSKLLLGSYPSGSAKQIEIFKYIRDSFRRDIDKFSAGSQAHGQSDLTLSICGMLLNQTFETILRKLDSSPVLATRLSETAGVRFDHISFNQGAVRMTIDSDIAAVHIRLGALADTF